MDYSALKNIKAIFFDVDGTLTDGHIYISENGEAFKAFSCKDGYGIKNILPKIGVVPVIITGRTSKIVARRASELNIEHIYQGIDDKAALMQEIFEKLGISSNEAAYFGDDFNDFEAMQLCAFKACPNDAASGIKEYVDYVCKQCGGKGAAREFIDLLASEK